jgi:hypothetical protein
MARGHLQFTSAKSHMFELSCLGQIYPEQVKISVMVGDKGLSSEYND